MILKDLYPEAALNSGQFSAGRANHLYCVSYIRVADSKGVTGAPQYNRKKTKARHCAGLIYLEIQENF
jgi:hypothetical protein